MELTNKRSKSGLCPGCGVPLFAEKCVCKPASRLPVAPPSTEPAHDSRLCWVDDCLICRPSIAQPSPAQPPAPHVGHKKGAVDVARLMIPSLEYYQASKRKTHEVLGEIPSHPVESDESWEASEALCAVEPQPGGCDTCGAGPDSPHYAKCTPVGAQLPRESSGCAKWPDVDQMVPIFPGSICDHPGHSSQPSSAAESEKHDLHWNHALQRWEFWCHGKLKESMAATEAADWPYSAKEWLKNLQEDCLSTPERTEEVQVELPRLEWRRSACSTELSGHVVISRENEAPYAYTCAGVEQEICDAVNNYPVVQAQLQAVLSREAAWETYKIGAQSQISTLSAGVNAAHGSNEYLRSELAAKDARLDELEKEKLGLLRWEEMWYEQAADLETLRKRAQQLEGFLRQYAEALNHNSIELSDFNLMRAMVGIHNDADPILNPKETV